MPATWDELDAKYGAPQANTSAATTAPQGSAWDQLDAKYAAPTSAPAASTRETAEKPSPGSLKRLQAGMTGINRGFYTDLAGFPVDAVANAVDLVKAGIGTAYIASTGKPAHPLLEPYDRSKVPLTGDWLTKVFNQVGLGGGINNPNPEDPASRVLYSGGRFAGASIIPNPTAKISGTTTAANMAMGAAGGLAAGATAEVAPSLAPVAGLLPALAGRTAADTVRYLSRGGEAGRRDMAQRVQDFKNAGVDQPTLGLATGNKLIQGVENLLSYTPGSMGAFDRSNSAILSGLQNRTNMLANSVSPVRGAEEAGAAVQRDISGPFKERVFGTYNALSNKVDAALGQNPLIPVDQTLSTVNRLTTPIPGAPATSANFINPRIRQIGQDLMSDAGGRPPMKVNGLVLGPDGKPTSVTTPGAAPTGVPYSAVSELRTKIGKEASSNAIIGTPEQAQFKQVYGSLSQDMKNGVSAADLLNGTKGTEALNRANAYYSRAMDRVEALQPIVNRPTPEAGFNALTGSMSAGPTTFERTRNAVSVDTRRKVAATIIEDLGKANPGQQNAEGTNWSPKTFITNYSKMDPAARAAIFKRFPGGAKYEADLTDIAKAADMINQSSRVWANPSGTGAAIANRTTLASIAGGAFLMPMVAAGAAGGLVGANQISQRLLLNPDFVSWLAKAPQVKATDMQTHAQTLLENARLSEDRQYQKDVRQYLESVKNSAQ